MDYLSLRDHYVKERVRPGNKQMASKEQPVAVSKGNKVMPILAGMLLAPTAAFADTFSDIHQTVMSIFDGGVVIVIISAGAAWALGHRSKGIELLIGSACGYLLASHAIEIRDYLKSIGA